MSGNKRGGSYCLVYGCRNRTRDGNFTFFGLPKESERINHWLTVCLREDLFGKTPAQLKAHRICAAHFEDKMFTNFLKKRLLPKAVPTIFSFVENIQGDVQKELAVIDCPRKTPIHSEMVIDYDAGPSTSASTTSNCSNDSDMVLTNLGRIDQTSVITVGQVNELTQNPVLSLPDTDYRNEDSLSQNGFTYVCGYLLRKVLKVHSCVKCSELGGFSELETGRLLTYYKAYDNILSTYGRLQAPKEKFIQYIYKLEKLFFEKFDSFSTEVGIGKRYLELFREIEFSHDCAEFDKLYLIKLFTRLRIFYSLKFSNRDLTSNKSTSRKIKILSHL